MKAVIDKEHWTITLDKEAIKAIRFVYGLNTDLRVPISVVHADKLWWWIDKNAYSLFGTDISDIRPLPIDEDWHKYEMMINGVVLQVLNQR